MIRLHFQSGREDVLSSYDYITSSAKNACDIQQHFIFNSHKYKSLKSYSALACYFPLCVYLQAIHCARVHLPVDPSRLKMHSLQESVFLETFAKAGQCWWLVADDALAENFTMGEVGNILW